MGVEDYLVTSTVNGVLAQRLVRKLCPHCREPYRRAAGAGRAQLDLAATGDDDRALSRRAAASIAAAAAIAAASRVLEFLPLTDAHPAPRAAHATAQRDPPRRRRGRHALDVSTTACARRVAGVTSIEEVLRVTRDI